jgi:mono/diheme cytochrome c family protein
LLDPPPWSKIRIVILSMAIVWRAARLLRAGASGVIPGFLILWTSTAAAATPSRPAAQVDFNRQIRPILSDHCFACHGPDEGKRKAGLRLDREEDAFRTLKSGRAALVAGKPEDGTLVERILTKDPDEVMPPPEHGKPLSPAQVELLQAWVRQGARWHRPGSRMPGGRAMPSTPSSCPASSPRV